MANLQFIHFVLPCMVATGLPAKLPSITRPKTDRPTDGLPKPQWFKLFSVEAFCLPILMAIVVSFSDELLAC